MQHLLKRISLGALTVFAGLAAALIERQAAAATWNISMTADGFSPSYLEVTVGDRVYWWNDDDIFYDDHSTHSYTYAWNSGAVPYGYGVYLDTTKTGSYDYIDDVGYSGTGTLVIKPPSGPPPPTLIPAPNRVDMVYDQVRDVLYITSQSQVLRYQLGSDSFLSPYQLSGNLMGIDLSPDGNTLMVADSSANTNVWVYLINLNTDETNKVTFPAASGESGTFAVAFGGDGAALISSRCAGSGRMPLRRYDPVSGLTTTISTFIDQDSMVSASGDGTTIIIAESNNSGGPMDLYDVATRTIVRTAGDGRSNYESAASRDGSLFAIPTYFGTYIYNRTFTQITNIGVYAGAQPIGAAFHPSADAVFFPFAGTTYVNAYSTVDWSLLGQFDFQNTFSTPGNHAFTNGRIRISPDGQIIFVTVSGGVSYLRHGLSLPQTHRLLVTGNPNAYGTPSPIPYGSYWLSHGTNITISVPAVAATNGAGFLCSGWTGTGSAAGAGSGTSMNLTLLANSTLTWNWTPLAVSANVVSQAGGNQLVLQWPSLDGATFDILSATSLQSGFTPLVTDIAATPPTNVYQIPIGSTPAAFYKVRIK
jgi:plastocyanin